jgi:hypothetical protein
MKETGGEELRNEPDFPDRSHDRLGCFHHAGPGPAEKAIAFVQERIKR